MMKLSESLGKVSEGNVLFMFIYVILVKIFAPVKRSVFILLLLHLLFRASFLYYLKTIGNFLLYKNKMGKLIQITYCGG